MARRPLRASGTVQLVGGNGTVKIGPLSAREIWYPDNVHIKCLTKTLEARCNIYVGPDTGPDAFRDESVLGSSGDSSGAVSADRIPNGWYVWAVWTGGDASTYATLTVTGQKDV